MPAKSKLPKDFDLVGLCSAIQQSRLTSVRPRQERTAAVRQYVGRHYAEEGSRHAVPVNLLGLYVQIMSRSLVAKNPRVMLSTFQKKFKPVVSAMEAWANRQIVKVRLAKTIERMVVDSFFNVGIVKVALASPADAAASNWGIRAGEPFADVVDLDDFVYDIHTRDYSKAGFLGHRVRVPVKALEKWISNKAELESLQGQEDPFFNPEGDERISMISRGYYSNREQYEDMVDLWEIYVPRHRLVITLLEQQLTGPTASGSNEPLHVQPWLGPDEGPYHFLELGTVPGNAPPKAPIMDLIDTHEAVNRCYRKLFRTIDRLKEVTACRDGHTEDGEHVMEANDGDLVTVADPQNLVQLVFSGNTLQVLLLVAPHLKDLFSWMAGNLESLAGLSPQAKTLGQDELLKASASLTVSDMQDRTVQATSSVLNALCWYWHHDPFRVMQSEYQIQGLNKGIVRTIKPEQRRQFKYEDMDVKVDPYSMQHSTPESKMAQINQVVTQIVIPMMQLLVQQGVQFDVNEYLKKLATYMDMPDLADIITIAEPPAPPDGAGESGGASDGPLKPAQTERTYNRTNMPGRTRQGDDLNLRSAVLGVNPGGNPNTAKGPRNMIGSPG